MKFNPKSKTSNIFLLVGSFIVVSLILLNTNSFFKTFKEEERLKMEIWATAQSEFLHSAEDVDLGSLHLKVFQNNTSTPMILINKDSTIRVNNIPAEKASDSLYIQKKLRQFQNENTPVSIDQQGEHLATLYYGNSEVLNKLKYYPIALLLGWNELLKSEHINPDITKEIAKDIDRLETITERFSKIGSLPKLNESDIVQETKAAFDYLKKRSSKLIHFTFNSKVESQLVLMNSSLFNWTIENLVKNGIDAMRGKGSIAIEIVPDGKFVNILVADTGHGIPKSNFTSIFNPGVTSKRRGWGLGLSLVKRIIEEYHNGKIKVLSSGKEGTIMQISLKAHK